MAEIYSCVFYSLKPVRVNISILNFMPYQVVSRNGYLPIFIHITIMYTWGEREVYSAYFITDSFNLDFRIFSFVCISKKNRLIQTFPKDIRANVT